MFDVFDEDRLRTMKARMFPMMPHNFITIQITTKYNPPEEPESSSEDLLASGLVLFSRVDILLYYNLGINAIKQRLMNKGFLFMIKQVHL